MSTPLQAWRPRPWTTALTLLVALLLLGRVGQAQVDTYTFAPSTGTFTPLVGGTNVSTIQGDDVLSGVLPLGFTFVFDGSPYTSCLVSSNGWLTFNTGANTSNLTNDLATGPALERPLVAPYWDDLNGTSGGVASYLTTGTSPNRVFTFQWLNWYRYGSTGPSISMQVQLVEGTNIVRFVYRQDANPISGAGASIGLSGVGSGPGSFLSLNNTSTSPTASSTVETNSIATQPATGQIYTFTPPVPALCPTARNLSVVSTTATSALVSYTVTNTPAGPFTILYGPTGFNPALPPSTTNVYSTMTAPGTTATITGLTASTTYQFYVMQNCGGTSGNGSLSNAGSFMTACLTPLYAALPVTESFENTWISRCDTRDVPNNNWRNTPATGNNSWRREDDGAAGAWTGPTSGAYTPVSSQGLHSARFHSYNATSGTIGTFDLFVNMSAAGAKRLSFDFINTSGSDSLVVQLSNDGGLTFSRLAGYLTSATFTTQVLPVASTSATAVIRFRAKSDYGVTDIGLDNVILESATGCLTPASLSSTTTTTTATLNWLTGGTGTYTVLYGPTGFNPATGGTAITGLTAPPYTITGLTPGTTYQFYVTLNCAGGSNSGTAGPASFTTQIVNDDPCGATILTINNTCTPLATTTFGATATPSTVYAASGSGTCSTNTTPHDVWFKFTTAATGPTSTAVRISVTGAPASVVSVYSGTACTGPLTFRVCSGIGANVAAPNLDVNSLTPSTTYYVRVSEYTNGNTLGNFTICATPIPNCPSPGGLNAAAITSTSTTLTWLAGTAGSTYNVYYGPTGFTPPTGGTALTGLTTTSAPITGLAPNTEYQFYVMQVCSGFNGSSVLSAPFTFMTLMTPPANNEPCGAVALPSGTTISSTNVGATTSLQPGINLPACSSTAVPNDVWFSFTAASAARSFTCTGAAAGMVRVYTSPSCSAGPFVLVRCVGLANNTSVGTFTVTGLAAGTTYYVAVSGYGGTDPTGTFTISSATVTATRAQAQAEALQVYPNPSSTGQLTLQLSGLSGAGQATLLNALGQVVLTKEMANVSTEQTLSTSRLATGIYTLRVAVAGQVLTRKVVLE
ncbi:T9SS type A sorting domain-containing protein [Hymenobacter rubidus]|uniref:T9SS type A sorting domain-containing protein n=1 Tax=Hymenobacter rubidus TaxID=1441626 RepID=UPI00191CEC4C|nr:fibronectin type III domain-containing protein [Hymenobacter rubidus]